MMWFTLYICLFGLVASQHDPAHEQMINFGFHHLDTSPNDGHVSEAEFTAQIQHMDADNDKCVPMSEYLNTHQQLPVSSTHIIFRTMDADSNDCLTTSDLQTRFNEIDLDGDKLLTSPEFEKYMMNIINTVILG